MNLVLMLFLCCLGHKFHKNLLLYPPIPSVPAHTMLSCAERKNKWLTGPAVPLDVPMLSGPLQTRSLLRSTRARLSLSSFRSFSPYLTMPCACMGVTRFVNPGPLVTMALDEARKHSEGQCAPLPEACTTPNLPVDFA